MTKKHTFKATIIDAGGGGAFVEVPFDVEKAFGSKRPKVKVMIEGVPYRGTLVRMKSENHLFQVSVELDVEERVAVVPAELKRSLKSDKEAKSIFEKLSYTHQKEYVTWIEDAKKDETRIRRISQTLELLKKRKKSR